MGMVFVAALVVALALAGPVFAQDKGATVRLAHLSQDAPSMDVYVDDEPVEALTNVPYKTISPYLQLPAGTRNLKAYAAGDTSQPLIETEVDLRSGGSYTVGAVGLAVDGSLSARIYEDDNVLPAPGNAKLRVIHAVPDVASVDISARDGEPLFTALGFPNATGYVEVPAGTYALDVNAAGTDASAFVVPEATFSEGAVYSAFAVGQAEDRTLEVLVTEDSGSSGGGDATSLDVIPGSLPTASSPETGGASPMLLLSGIMLVVIGLLGACFGKG